MEAMSYETLIRNVYGGGRTDKNGANADIYRAMERAYRELQSPMMNTSNDAKEVDFQQNFAGVRSHVRQAIEEGIGKIKYRATVDDITSLNSMKEKLGWRFYDKEELDIIIHDATTIFFKNELFQ